MSRTGFATMVALLLVVAAGGCDRSATPEAPPERLEISVMTFNIEWGGANVSFDNVIEAIRLAGADVVGVQEAQGNLARLATALGWHYDRRNHVISRFPLLDPPGGDSKYVLVEVEPGRAVAIANLHLPSDPYGPDLVRDGAAVDAVLQLERDVRLPPLQSILERLPPLLAAGYPVFVTGDFNSPAHTDWTPAMVGQRPFLRYAVDWPVSRAMHEAGFSDAWRTVHADVKAKPGLTWWAGRPPLEAYAPGVNDPQDRIDMIWSAGVAQPLTARLIGETGGPGVDAGVLPWPSDHRAVVVTFAVDARPLPDLLTTDRRVYGEGDAVRVIGHFDGAEPDVLITACEDGAVIKRLAAPSLSEPLRLEPGHYCARAAVAAVSFEREFWVVDAADAPAVTVLDDVVTGGEPLAIAWRGAPGDRFDYIGLYAADADNLEAGMLAYAYTGSRPAGSLDLRSAAVTPGGSLPPGAYIARLMQDDGYEVLAESEVFEIR